jgi:capsular exopolysaccharide synthesis family protein
LARDRKAKMPGRYLVTLVERKSPIAEQYRTIRTNLHFASVNQEIRTIVITSPRPGEGKSTTAANLAVVYGQEGKKVLLVDGDLRKPTMHYTFRLLNHRGLTNFLMGECEFEKVVFDSSVENVSVVTCGPIPPNPLEVLGSKKMDWFIEKAKQEYDVIIFDTPPVLTVADSSVIAERCDGVLMVIRSKQTESADLMKAKEQLDRSGTKLLGAVLNDKKHVAEEYYYYGV